MKLPASFRHLKESLASHFKGYHHKMAVANLKQLTSLEEAADHSTAKRILRTGYLALNRSMSQDLFEELICFQNCNGLKMGNINHSKTMLQKMRSIFHNIILEDIRRFCDSSACVSWVADKHTLRHKTVDVIGLQCIVPKAPIGKMIQTLIIAAPEVR